MSSIPFTPLTQTAGIEALLHMLRLQPTIESNIPSDVVFVSIDIESASWLPKSHAKQGCITEIGVAVLDTRAIRETDPGPGGSNWLQFITAKHYQTRETARLSTRKLDRHGAPLWAGDKFEFGRSIQMPKHDLKDTIVNDLRIPDEERSVEDGAESSSMTSSCSRYRDVVLVTHAWENEDAYLREQLSFSYTEVGTISGILDTQILERFGPRPGLLTLMGKYGILPLHRHNGGNDSVYTLAVLIARGVSCHLARNGQSTGDHRGAEECLLKLKETIAATIGRCNHCQRYGHRISQCAEWLLTEDGKSVALKQNKGDKVLLLKTEDVELLGGRSGRAVSTIPCKRPIRLMADLGDELQFPSLRDASGSSGSSTSSRSLESQPAATKADNTNTEPSVPGRPTEAIEPSEQVREEPSASEKVTHAKKGRKKTTYVPLRLW
ncbi:hypothetical protein BU16DRAFT_540337 [Lophium mytilinum]|uniref:Gfd2/YDR514C-like C-terminal domain-containing protein n=1 Tax=Lophium mytilinum TaxID=390894 RepID=A0A6A6QP58_9PEZI|nr:hypothetical protein BU16DRAFT_540337 [Lophium mytilinum]